MARTSSGGRVTGKASGRRPPLTRGRKAASENAQTPRLPMAGKSPLSCSSTTSGSCAISLATMTPISQCSRTGSASRPWSTAMSSRLRGPEQSRETAKSVLEQLYGRLAQGEMIGVGEVVGAIRHARHRRSRGRSRPNDAKLPAAQQIRTRKRLITARTPAQSAYLSALQSHDLVFATGPAGTGKTYLAVAFAAACLESGKCDRLILSRPAVEAGERLGFLPGDMREKVDPYLRPLYDALYDVLAPERVERGLATGMIEIAPLAFMRGRTLSHAMIILDEAQNYHADADEDVPHQARRRQQDDRDRRSDPDRPPAGQRFRAARGHHHSRRHRGHRPYRLHRRATWFAASWSARLSTPMRRRPSGVSAMADAGPSRSSGTSSLEIDVVRHARSLGQHRR